MPSPRAKVRAQPPLAPQPEHAALRAAIHLGGLLRRLSEPHFATYGLSPAQWGVLRALDRLQQGGQANPRMHELGAALLVQPPSLSATLDRMERVGLIVRRQDPDDHRTRRVELTRAGRRTLDGALESHHLWIRTIMGGLPPADLKRLTSLLASLTAHMEHLAKPPAKPASPKRLRLKRSDS